MGKLTPSGVDLLQDGVVEGSFSATGQSTSKRFKGDFNFTRGAGNGTLVVERSFDGGTTWYAVSIDLLGTANSFTGACSLVLNEPEAGVLYRVNCTAYTGPAIPYRLSQ